MVNIDNYNIIRKDRSSHEHGGVCIYIKDHIKYETPKNLKCCEDYKIVWLKLNLSRTPRGFACILIAVVYYPGRTSPAESNATNITNHLFDSLTTAESMFPNCGIIIAGDFNHLSTTRLQNHFKLKQLVNQPTRGTATLDIILTNMSDHFSTPELFPPFGLSDHNCVILEPKSRVPNQHTRKSVTVRDMRESTRASLGHYFSSIDWSCVETQDTCEEKLKVFRNLIGIGLENIMPEKTIKVYPKDAPWMSVKLKELIRQRQAAFHSNKYYKFYRNVVNRERKKSKAIYYSTKVQDLKGVNPRKWWQEICKLRGANNQNSNPFCSLNVPQYTDKSPREIANAINDALLETLQTFQPLDCETSDIFLPLEENPVLLEVPTYRVYDNLIHLNKHKAPGPDGHKEQKLPSIWKHVDITPLPKVKQVSDPKKDFRPISLTPALSKIAEDFVVSTYIKPAVGKVADPNQFGTISSSSTVLALISMVHYWLQTTDGNGAYVRIMLFDYRKAFDMIDHSTLVAKLKNVDIPKSITNWVIDFPSDRSQRVKLGNDCLSEWGRVPSGVPQGTKLGPWLFLLMINDLSIPDIFNMWKYVDDSAVS